jgi:hypothetical protein
MGAHATTFDDLLDQTWHALRAFDLADLAVVERVEEVALRAPAELGSLSVQHGFGERELIWLSLPSESGRVVSALLRAVEVFEGSARFEARLQELRAAGIRLQTAASAIAGLTAERMTQGGVS